MPMPMAYARRQGANPNEAGMSAANGSPAEHPDDEMEPFVAPSPPSIHRRPLHPSPSPSSAAAATAAPLPSQQQQQQQQLSPQHAPSVGAAAYSSIASKPHAFGGAILSPDHARNITTDLALQLASALSVQASHAASSRGVLPPGEDVNLFRGSSLADVLTGWNGVQQQQQQPQPLPGGKATQPTQPGGVDRAGSREGSVFRSNATASSYAHTTPGGDAPSPHILQLLHHGGSSSGGAPSPTTKQSVTPGGVGLGNVSSSFSSMNTPTGLGDTVSNASTSASIPTPTNPLSLLSTAEALESFGAWRTHYTVWITEAWHILKWSEPSAALFWEMATMFHTLYVASLSVRGGGSGGEVRRHVLGVSPQGDEGAGVVGGGGGGAGASEKARASTATTATLTSGAASTGNYIPPLLSCGSQSSMGSVRSANTAGTGGYGAYDATAKDHGGGGGGGAHGAPSPNSKSLYTAKGGGNIKLARHSEKELPVWLISMFLLVHCEIESFLRCTSGEDERSDAGASSSPISSSPDGAEGGGGALDFSALLHRRCVSPRGRPLHAHQNNANCAAFLLRHLRKFLLLCAVPRNAAACRAVATLAAKGGGPPSLSKTNAEQRSLLHRYSGGGRASIDIERMEEEHREEHGATGLTVELTVEELDRLHLVLQAPSGGLVDDPPVAIGEFVLRVLAQEETDAVAAAAVSGESPRRRRPQTPRWDRLQNGLIALADAERVLRKYLEEELTMAKQELDGGGEAAASDHHHHSPSAEDAVASKLSKLSLGGSSTPLSPPRASRAGGVSSADADAAGADTLKDASTGYLKELSYQKLRSTTVLLEPGKDTAHGGGASPTHGGGGHEDSFATADSQEAPSQTSSRSFGANQQPHPSPPTAAPPSQSHGAAPTPPNNNNHNDRNSGRLHDLHVADCTDTHFYLLQPFEHATIAACTDCTIVLGAVAGLLHVVDCERTTVTSAARRVVVANSLDVVHYLFTPSPPLLVGDNRGCQFAPYNTYYEGLKEDLLATGLAAVLRSAASGVGAGGSSGGSVLGDNGTTASPGRGGSSSPTAAQPMLQCASNKWKVPVELCKLEVPSLPNMPTPGSPANLGESSLGADDRDVAMKTPVLLPPSEFDVLLVPVESKEARFRRRLAMESQAEAAAAMAATAANTHDQETASMPGAIGGACPHSDAMGEEASTTSSLTGVTGDREKSSEHLNSSQQQPPPSAESDYCRILADLLTLSPFHMPHDYERRVISKAERVKTLKEAIVQELTEEQRLSLEEELDRGFHDWLVTSGNLRQVLDLIHLEKRVSTT